MRTFKEKGRTAAVSRIKLKCLPKLKTVLVIIV